MDGYDEISLTGKFKAISNVGEKLLSPELIGFKTQQQQDIFGGETVKDAAKIFLAVLNNESTYEQKNVVLANSSFAIQCFESSKSLDECRTIAEESIESGKAFQSLKLIIQ